MKRMILTALAGCLIFALTGCGGGGSPPPVTTQILSDPAFDGDIAQDPVTGTLTVTQGNTPTVFAGIDPVTGQEFRAFLDFPLGGPGGVPLNAVIVSATLDIVIDSISPLPQGGSIPIRIDLVDFQPPTLLGADFDRVLQPPLASTTIFPPITQADLGGHVPVDVTALMTEAQRRGQPDFQVRILEDFGFVTPGLIGINDTTAALAPLLEVTYF